MKLRTASEWWWTIVQWPHRVQKESDFSCCPSLPVCCIQYGMWFAYQARPLYHVTWGDTRFVCPVAAAWQDKQPMLTLLMIQGWVSFHKKCNHDEISLYLGDEGWVIEIIITEKCISHLQYEQFYKSAVPLTTIIKKNQANVIVLYIIFFT